MIDPFKIAETGLSTYGDFFGEIFRPILMTRDFGDFFGYFCEKFGEILSKPSGHTAYC